MIKPSPLPKTRPAGSEWNVMVRSGEEEVSLNGLFPPTYWPKMCVVASSPSKMVSISLSLRFRLEIKNVRKIEIFKKFTNASNL